MKKRWIPFIVLSLAATFIYGQLSGASSEAERQETRQKQQEKMSTTIAIVNADTGMTTEDGKLSYSAAIIDTLGDNFVLVSPVMAYNGYQNGTYGAVVTFPSDVSTKILSFNTKEPEKVQLEFQVNPNLPEKSYIETYVAILDLQTSINTTLAHTYVSSIYDQFHVAQDQVGLIFQNDQSDLSALDTIKLKDYTEGLDLDNLPEIPLDPDKADTERYMNDVEGFADYVSGLYLNSYGAASNRYIPMRDGLFQITEDFPEQEEEWMNRLSDWANISVDYGKNLEEYSAAVDEHEEGLVAWHSENVEWNESLTEYQGNVADWHENLKNWYAEAGEWYAEYQSYLEASAEYMEEVSQYRTDLSDKAILVMEDLEKWKEEIDQEGQQLFEDIAESYVDYNDSVDDLRSNLNDYQTIYESIKSDLEDFQSELQLKIPSDPALQDLDEKLTQALDSLETLPDPSALDPGEAPDLDDYTPWSGTKFSFPEYNGEEIPDADDLAANFPEPGTTLPEVMELAEATDYEGSEVPEEVDENEPLTVEQPDNPLVDPPPKPEDFWASLDRMHEQLSSFNIQDYLSDDVKQEVDKSLQSYDAYLDTVRDDLGIQFEGNVSKMYEVQYGYMEYLANLRAETLETSAAEHENLQNTIEGFSAIKQENSEDTRERLSFFAGLMPESRSPAGLNKNLIGFTVAPFNFSPPALRPATVVDTSTMQPLTDTYQRYLWIALPAAGGVLLLTVMSCVFTYYRRRQRRNAEET